MNRRDLLAVLENVRTSTIFEVDKSTGMDLILYAARSLSSAFEESGFRDRRVALCMHNSSELLSVLLGLWHSESTPVLLRPTDSRLAARNCRNVKAAGLITDSNQVENLISGLGSRVTSFRGLSGNIVVVRFSDSETPDSLEDAALVLLSAGSSGVPKGIRMGADQILWNAQAVAKVLLLRSEDHFFIAKPLTHSSTLVAEALVALINGCPIHLVPQFNPRLMLSAMEGGVRYIVGCVPAMARLLADRAGLLQATGARSDLVVSGEPVPPALVLRLDDLAPLFQPFIAYGLTEAGPRVSMLRPSEARSHPLSVGRPLDGIKVFCCDEYSRPLPQGVPGQIVVDTPSAMLGYVGSFRSTSGTIYTGDVGYVDSEGYLHVTGRMDNLIMRGGYKLYPEEIEVELLSHPGIRDALVASSRNQHGELIITAKVVLDETAMLTPQDILQYSSLRLPAHKRPTLVQVVPSIGTLAVGKKSRNRPEDGTVS